MNKHRSVKLDAMLGKNVLVIFFDNTCDIGRLEWDENCSRYRVADTLFRKSHIRKIELMGVADNDR